jgi:hypothetical protein
MILAWGSVDETFERWKEKKVMKLSQDIKATKIYPGLVGPEMQD